MTVGPSSAMIEAAARAICRAEQEFGGATTIETMEQTGDVDEYMACGLAAAQAVLSQPGWWYINDDDSLPDEVYTPAGYMSADDAFEALELLKPFFRYYQEKKMP